MQPIQIIAVQRTNISTKVLQLFLYSQEWCPIFKGQHAQCVSYDLATLHYHCTTYQPQWLYKIRWFLNHISLHRMIISAFWFVWNEMSRNFWRGGIWYLFPRRHDFVFALSGDFLDQSDIYRIIILRWNTLYWMLLHLCFYLGGISRYQLRLY